MTDREIRVQNYKRLDMLDTLYAQYSIQCRKLEVAGEQYQPLQITQQQAEVLQYLNNPLPTWTTTC
jgi:hypothetical protein